MCDHLLHSFRDFLIMWRHAESFKGVIVCRSVLSVRIEEDEMLENLERTNQSNGYKYESFYALSLNKEGLEAGDNRSIGTKWPIWNMKM